MKLKDQQQPGEEGYGVIDENDLVVLGMHYRNGQVVLLQT